MPTDNGFTNYETEHAVLMIMNDYQTYQTLIHAPRCPSWQQCKNAVLHYVENEFKQDEETREELHMQMASVNWKEVKDNVRAKREELVAETVKN